MAKPTWILKKIRAWNQGLCECSANPYISSAIGQMERDKDWLVVWNIFFIFPYIGLLIIPIDELIFFRGVAQAPTKRPMFVSADSLDWREN